jgi:hypothetical protein
MTFSEITQQITNPLAKNIRYNGSFGVAEVAGFLNRNSNRFLSQYGLQDRFTSVSQFKDALLLVYKHINPDMPPKSQRIKDYQVEDDNIKFYVVDNYNVIYLAFKIPLTIQEIAFIKHHLHCDIEFKDTNIAILK